MYPIAKRPTGNDITASQAVFASSAFTYLVYLVTLAIQQLPYATRSVRFATADYLQKYDTGR